MHDIAEFLKGREPFDSLDEEALDSLARGVEVEFFPAGQSIFMQGGTQEEVRVVRRGAVELVDEGRVLDELGEGEMFGHPSMLSGLPAGFEARASEDTLCYRLAEADVVPLLSRPASLGFLARSLMGRRGAAGDGLAGLAAAQPTAGSLVREAASTCGPELPVRDAARQMVAEGASSMLVEMPDGTRGILTDRDLRARVVAAGMDPDTPVREAMTSPVITVPAERGGAELMTLMLDNDIRHVPVTDADGAVVGIVSAADLLAADTRSPFVLRRAIAEAADADELREQSLRLHATVIALHDAGLAPAQTSEVISVVADALVTRMIDLAIAAEGPPPADFTWISLGSHGRREAVPSSDVDSGMSWRGAEGASPAEQEAVGVYMRAIADGVAGCVEALDWRLDPHGVTASGVFSAHSIGDWGRIIPNWLADPSDERVLIAASILLDGRVLRGPADLDPRPILRDSANSPAVRRWMLRLAVAKRPPTGFRRRLVLGASGEDRRTLDLKHGGLLPVINVARYAALAADADETSTVARLRAAAGSTLDPEHARTLEEAYDLFAALRLDHQVERLRAGEQPDDEIDAEQLDPLTRRYLRDAFREVAAVQKKLSRELAPPAF